jgi:hypothetical protein
MFKNNNVHIFDVYCRSQTTNGIQYSPCHSPAAADSSPITIVTNGACHLASTTGTNQKKLPFTNN